VGKTAGKENTVETRAIKNKKNVDFVFESYSKCMMNNKTLTENHLLFIRKTRAERYCHNYMMKPSSCRHTHTHTKLYEIEGQSYTVDTISN
jgi:hypothetical protein